MILMRWLTKLFYTCLILTLILAGILVFLFCSEPGLRTLIHVSQLYLSGSVTIQKLHGTFWDGFSATEVRYQDKSLNAHLQQLTVHIKPHFWQDKQFLNVAWRNLWIKDSTREMIQSTDGALTATGSLPKIRLKVHALGALVPEDHWLLDATMQGVLPWQWTLEAHLAPSPKRLATQGLYTQIEAKGALFAKNKGNLQLRINPGVYQMPNNNTLSSLAFNGGRLQLLLSPKQLIGTGHLSLDPQKNLKVQFELPKFSLDQGLHDAQPIAGTLSFAINSLDFLQHLAPEIKNLKGKFNATVSVKGTLGKTQIQSDLMLSQTSLSLPFLGLNLDNVVLKAHSKEKNWDATGTITSENHNLIVKGKGILNANATNELTLEGKDFPLIATHEYQIKVSPELKLQVTPTTQLISGKILIPTAQIKPQSFNNSLSLPDEVVYKNQENSAPILLNTNMDVAIAMGDAVEINVKGLKGFLKGIIHLKQVPNSPINAYGELSVRKGIYKAYGQDLAIKQGQLVFTGGPINNPGINVRAAKTINITSSTFSSSTQLFDLNNNSNLQNIPTGETMTLGVEVSGRLAKPKIQLFSNPSTLSQADILSMLVLGRPANQAYKAGGQLLLTAISSMNLGSNHLQLLEQIKQSSGLDFNVQTNTSYNQVSNTTTDSTAFVVGKALSKRLYLSYNIGLSQTDTNMLTLKYLINKFFSIQVSNSINSNAIDLLYTSYKKKKTKIHPKNSSTKKG